MSRPAATLHLLATMEEFPVVRVEAYSAEDAERLAAWLDHPGVRARLVDALLDALDGLEERAA